MVQYDLTNIFQSFLDIQRVRENEAPFITKNDQRRYDKMQD